MGTVHKSPRAPDDSSSQRHCCISSFRATTHVPARMAQPSTAASNASSAPSGAGSKDSVFLNIVHERNIGMVRKLLDTALPVAYADAWYADLVKTPHEFTKLGESDTHAWARRTYAGYAGVGMFSRTFSLLPPRAIDSRIDVLTFPRPCSPLQRHLRGHRVLDAAAGPCWDKEALHHGARGAGGVPRPRRR